MRCGARGCLLRNWLGGTVQGGWSDPGALSLNIPFPFLTSCAGSLVPGVHLNRREWLPGLQLGRPEASANGTPNSLAVAKAIALWQAATTEERCDTELYL